MCNSPSPSPDGLRCPGNDNDEAVCNTQPCSGTIYCVFFLCGIFPLIDNIKFKNFDLSSSLYLWQGF